jgi:hypothetical protein
MIPRDILSRLFAAERISYAQHQLSVWNTFSYKGTAKMPDLLIGLKRKRSELLEQLLRLRDFRAGSITALVRRCGKSTCRCARAGDPGHGPNLRLTYKLNGKTYSEALPDQAAVRKARSEVIEFRRFQRLVKAIIEVNAQICRLRSTDAFASRVSKKHRDFGSKQGSGGIGQTTSVAR